MGATEGSKIAPEAARWPRVALGAAEFEAFLEARDAASLDADRRAELFLSCACARGDAAALEAFDAEVLTPLRATLGRFGDDTFAGEVCQAARARLLSAETGAPKIAEYRGRGPLAKFVQAVLVRTALNLLEARGRQPSAPGDDDDALAEVAAPVDDPELMAMKSRYRGEFKQAFKDAMASLEDDHRTALRLYYLDGLGLADLSRLFGWSVPTASRRLAAARQGLLEATRALMGERLALTPLELDSVLRLISSRLTIDLPEPEPR